MPSTSTEVAREIWSGTGPSFEESSWSSSSQYCYLRGEGRKVGLPSSTFWCNKDGEAEQQSIFGVQMGLSSGRIYVGDVILSLNTYGLKYKMVLEWGFRQIFGVVTALLKDLLLNLFALTIENEASVSSYQEEGGVDIGIPI